MLDLLLNAPKDKRREMLKKIKLGTRKRIFDNIYTMTEELDLDDVPDFETRVKMRHALIERFPDMVFWDYAEIANPRSHKRIHVVPDFERFLSCKISTRGDVVIYNTINRLSVHVAEPHGRYHAARMGHGSKTVHRLIASTFLPVPDRLSHIPYRQLQVNHIDGTRWNCNIVNLEWVMDTENSRHRYHVDRYDEEKYFRFTVAVDNGFKGREFVLSEHSLHLIGTNFTEARKAILRSITYRGMYISMSQPEDAPIGFPTDIAELFNKDSRYFDTLIKPVIGTVLGGKYKGFTFSLFGSREISQYFNRPAVEAVVRGRLLSHFGCTFQRATHREAIPLHGLLTKEIADDARKSKKRFHSKDP